MADVINRVTLEYIRSVNTPDYPDPPWKSSPDMSLVTGVDSLYWIWDTGEDRPVEMDTGAKAVVDAGIIQDSENAAMAPLDELTLSQAFAMVVLDEINTHASTVTAILDAIDNATNLADVKTSVAAIADLTQRTGAQLKSAIRTKYQELRDG